MAQSGFDYDIFLSHAAADAPDADAVREALIGAGLTVYTDRHDDPLLDRTKVSRETANRLRSVMRRCNMLLYVVTEGAAKSRWMSWELGFFDGCRGRVLVYPVTLRAKARAKRQEYLDLFEILEPGSLLESVTGAVTRPDPLRPTAGLEAILKMAAEAPKIAAPADLNATDGYREHIASALSDPSGKKALELQRDVTTAWLRLWGIR